MYQVEAESSAGLDLQAWALKILVGRANPFCGKQVWGAKWFGVNFYSAGLMLGRLFVKMGGI